MVQPLPRTPPEGAYRRSQGCIAALLCLPSCVQLQLPCRPVQAVGLNTMQLQHHNAIHAHWRKPPLFSVILQLNCTILNSDIKQ
jgi:hypothetical protein